MGSTDRSGVQIKRKCGQDLLGTEKGQAWRPPRSSSQQGWCVVPLPLLPPAQTPTESAFGNVCRHFWLP